jgi:WD40 repeat protein
MPFNGFISYSHAADNQLAPAIQRGLHHLAKPWHRRRALWIFRDQTGLAVTPALWSSIQNALDGSDYFVLLASPEAARSPWVNREIEHWMARKSAQKILPVVTDGEWRWDPRTRDFSEDSTAVPAALRGAFAEEPLYLDLRWARDDRHLSLRHSRFRDAIAQLAAPMHGVSKDDLEGEDVRQHRRARRLRVGALSTLVLLTFVAVLTGLLAVRNADRANAAAREARVQQQSAATERGNAARSADDAKLQQARANDQRDRAAEAAAETAHQIRLAGEQRALAAQAKAEAERQQQLADDQKAAAAAAKADAAKEQKNAKQQRALADRAAARARTLQALATQERALAAKWAAEAQKAADAAAQQEAKATTLSRDTAARHLIGQARATIDDDPKTALMLGIAADKIQHNAESRREVTGLVTATRYAGTIDGAASATIGAGHLVATRTDKGVVSLWNATDRARPVPLATLPGVTADSVLLSPDGHTLAVLPHNGVVTLWDVTDPAHPVRGAELPELGYTTALAFTADGRTLAGGGSGGATVVQLYDVTHPDQPAALSTLHLSSAPTQIAFSSDGHTAVVGADTVAVFDVTDRSDPHQIAGIGVAFAPPIAYDPVHHTLAMATDNDGTVQLWSLADPAAPKMNCIFKASGWVTGLALQPGRDLLITMQANGQPTMWDLSNPVAPKVVGDLAASSDPVLAVTYSPDGQTLITTGGDSANLWNTEDYGAPQAVAQLSNHDGAQRASVFGPGGRSLSTVDVNGTASVWDLSNPARPKRRSAVHVGSVDVYTAAYSGDGRTVATGGSDNRLTISDLSDPKHPVTLLNVRVDMDGIAPPERFQAMAISPEGRTLAVATSYGRLLLWDLTDRSHPRPVFERKIAQYTSLAFSPDGHTLAAADASGRVELWDMASTAAPVQAGVIPHYAASAGAPAVSFGPDGHTLVTRGTNDRSAALWDVTDRAHPVRTANLVADSAALIAAAFSPDGRTLATLSEDAVAVMWDVSDPSDPVRIATMRREALAGGLRFSPDGHTLATGTADTLEPLTFWDYTAVNRIRRAPSPQACAMTGRGLTASEWARYIPNIPYEPTCRG